MPPGVHSGGVTEHYRRPELDLLAIEPLAVTSRSGSLHQCTCL
jgi:hypothetical protein